MDKASIRERSLPNCVVFYYDLMLAIFMGDSYWEVLRRLLDGFRDARRNRDGVKVVCKSGITQARARLGHELFKAIYEECVCPIAMKDTKGAWYRNWRVVSLDGSTLDVADSPENDQEFGRSTSDRGSRAFPKVPFVTVNRERDQSTFWSCVWTVWRGVLMRFLIHLCIFCAVS